MAGFHAEVRHKKNRSFFVATTWICFESGIPAYPTHIRKCWALHKVSDFKGWPFLGWLQGTQGTQQQSCEFKGPIPQMPVGSKARFFRGEKRPSLSLETGYVLGKTSH